MKTLPPPPSTRDPKLVRQTARANYAPDPAEATSDEAASAEIDEAPQTTQQPLQDTAPPVVVERIGRKRRQR